MKLTKEKLSLEEALKREWIITNGIGGYASSTIIGANTRKYHGLLVAPLIPPAKRYLILSKLDESIEIENKKYDLYTNICKGYISKGYEYQEAFKKEYMPIFTYKVNDVQITKIVCMEHWKNTVGIYYRVKTGDKNVKLNLAPVLNFRNAHYDNKNHIFNIEQNINKNKTQVIIDGNNEYPIYMKTSEGLYIKHEKDTFFYMFYIEEEKRGFNPEENHVVPGVFEIEIEANTEKEISFICSLEENIEELDARVIITKEIIRLNETFNESLLIDNRKQNKSEEEKKEDDLIKTFLIASDNFIVKRPLYNTYTVIAGYPWFLDWMRDTLIAFEGLFLIQKKYDIAKKVLKTCVRDIKYGLVPNGYSELDNKPLYNSVDSSLLLFEQAQKYLDYTGDNTFIENEIYPRLKKIIEHFKEGIDFDDNNIYLDTDGLIVSGTEKTQNTWMDAKYNGIPVTPRNGKAVEINSLWYNALKIIEKLAIKYKDKEKADEYAWLARRCKNSFEEKFYNKKRKCLYDVLGDSKIRPNQLFALSLKYPVLDPNSDIAKEMFETVTKKLLNKYGLKTLAKGEENYVETYEGDSFRRDFSYHQGITWPWLLGLYYDSLKNIILNEKNKKDKEKYEQKLQEFRKTTKEVFTKEIQENGCIGSISELYDSKKPFEPKGTIAQAWSVAEIFRIILGK